MRKFGVMLFCAISMMAAYAGDVANFVNLGFSPDGARFSFGQYGITDGDYRSYADIFCVDVAKNDFLKDGTFSTPPSASTAGKDSKGIFGSLQNNSSAYLKKNNIDSALQGRALYVQAEDEPKLKNISFRDFETSKAYAIKVNTLVEGTLEKVQASFYLTVEMTAADGKVTRKTVGLPGFMRRGVKDYLVRRIITDDSGKSLIFIIEKTLVGAKGSSSRFMVETLRL